MALTKQAATKQALGVPGADQETGAATAARSDRRHAPGERGSRKRWIGVIAFGFVVAVLFGANGPLGGFWGGEVGADEDIPGGALAGLITAGLVESVAFGVGLAWLAFGWRVVKNADRRLAVATYLSIGWALLSWFPHTSLHVSWQEDDWYGLAAIEWGFHVTLVVAALVVATYVWRSMRETASSGGSRAAALTG